MKNDELAEKVIGCAYEVSNSLGAGFLEKVYENALVHELNKKGIKTKQQSPIVVKYDGVVVGEYVADLLVNDELLVELKATESIEKVHLAQCLNYLKATRLKACLLVNFGKSKVQVRRLVNHF
jgi:GxxExxY protein